MSDGSELRHAFLPQKSRHVAADPPHAAGVEVAGFAQSRHNNTVRRYAAQRMHQRQLAQLAFDLAVSDQRGDRTVQRSVHRARRAARLRNSLK